MVDKQTGGVADLGDGDAGVVKDPKTVVAADGDAGPDKGGKPDPAKEAAKAKTATITDDGAGGDEPVAVATWPDKWRDEFAGSDKKLAARLARLDGPRAVLDWALNAEKKLSQRKTTLSPPDENATDEERATWRKAVGMPEAPEKYDIKLKGNRQLGDEDKPIYDEFAPVAFKAGMSNAQMSQVLDWYIDLNEKDQTQLMEDDQAYLDKTVTALREEWGPADYKRNIAAARGLFEGVTDKIPLDDQGEVTVTLEEAILGARMPNGRKIGADPIALRFLSKLGLDVLPEEKLLPDGEVKGSVDNRLAEIRKIRDSDIEAYNNNKALQAEELKLLGVVERRSARGKQAAA